MLKQIFNKTTVKAACTQLKPFQPFEGKRAFFTNNRYQKEEKGRYGGSFNSKYALAGAGALSAIGFFMMSTKSTEVAAATELYKDIVVEEAKTLQEGQMIEMKVGPKDNDKILVARYQGKIRACGNYCTHFGAPLATSVLFDDKVLCPWHDAAFSIVTGYPELAPAFDGLPVFDVFEDPHGNTVVRVPEPLPRGKTMPMSKRDPNNNTRFVIIGGGMAGINAAETFRQSQFTGEVIILSAEDKIPYDRTVLTKIIGKKVEDIFLRSENFLKEYDIDYRLGKTVVKVDNAAKSIQLSDGSQVSYDKLLIATGGIPFIPPIKNIKLNNVYVLRNYKDQVLIREAAAKAKKIVFVGGGFINLELASALKKQHPAIEMIIVDRNNIPLEHVFGADIGNALRKLHESNGIKFQMNEFVTELIGTDTVQKVLFHDGQIIEADMVVVGAGIKPATSFIEGVEKEADSSLRCDPYLRTSDKNIYAAGDMANIPFWLTGERVRIEHWNSAGQMGTTAAFNMAGRFVPYNFVPFFWTRQWEKSLQYAGHGSSFDDVFIDGDLDKLTFVAYYGKNNKIIAMSAMNRSPAIMILSEAMRLNLLPSFSDIKSRKEDVNSIKEKVKKRGGACKCERESCCLNK